MKITQSHPTIRKFGVRAIALLFIFSGLWYFWRFISPLFSVSYEKIINPVFLVYTFFLLRAGFGLFRLTLEGRDLTLLLLSIRAITNLYLLKLVLFPKLENRTAAITMFAWLFTVLLMIAFLLQKKTREVFPPEENSTALQSNTSP